MGLTVYQRKTLDLLISRALKGLAKITLPEVAEYLGVKTTTSSRQFIQALVTKGYVAVVPPDKRRDGNSYKILRTK